MREPHDSFTLLELLAVVVVVGILATLSVTLFRSVSNVRNQAESASHLRRWGTALSSYVVDHSGDLPRRGQGVQPVTQLDRTEDWFNALPPYLGTPQYGELIRNGRRPRENDRSIFVRPGARDPGGIAFLSYGMNMNLSPWNLPNATRMAQIERPSATVFLAESPGPYASTFPSARPFGCLAPHAGKGNILFLDGHVTDFDADYLGVGKGDPRREDVRWLTGTPSDAQAGNYQ